MAVICTKCGEELLGAVNRCWNCGTEFEAHSGAAEVPPVRRSPVVSPLAASLDAEVLPEAEGDSQDANQDDDGEPSDVVASSGPKRRGSPFATTQSAAVSSSQGPAAANQTAGPPSYPTNAGAIAGAFLAFPLGIAGVVVAFFFPAGALILAAVGIAMGSWGLYSKRRGVSIAGLLLCCIAVALGGFNGAVELYSYMHNGLKPWETGMPVSGP